MTLVVGATGRVGSEVVRQLRQQGRPVRALCRSEVKAKALAEAGVAITLGDLANRQAITTACQGADAIISAMTSLNPRSLKAEYQPDIIEGDGHRNLLESARQAGVKQVIYLSAIGVEHPEAPRQFQVKRQVEEAIRSGGLSYAILRPSGFMEDLVPMIQAIRHSPFVPLPGKGTAPITFIAVEDVARVAVQAIGHPEAQASTIEYGGPEQLTNRQCVHIAAQVFGRSARIIPIPLTFFHLMGTVARPVSPGLRELFAILHYVDRYGLRVSRRPPFSNQPWNPLSFEEFVRRHAR